MQLPNLEKRIEKESSPTKLTKEKLATKRGNKPQAPLASEQKSHAQVVWYMDHVYVGSRMVISQEVEPDVYVFGSGVEH